MENVGGQVWALPVNSQGNFCLRSKYGGNLGGGYQALTTGLMITPPTNGSCNTTGCHDSSRPIF